MKEFSSIVTTDSSASRARVRFFFLQKKKLQVAVLTFIFVVKDWIIVTSSENGTLSFAFLRLSSKKI